MNFTCANNAMKKLEMIQITLEELRMATRPNVYRNKKKYTRKSKYKNKECSSN
jgi:hypothetical protein